jgi:uncharacterized protein (TIGR02001 family)
MGNHAYPQYASLVRAWRAASERSDMSNKRITLLGGALLFCSAWNAHAESGLSYNIEALTNYVFRGISQSDNHPALQGGVDYKDAGGLYGGLWATTQDIPNTRSDVRGDAYGGFAYQASNGFGFDIGGRAYSNAFVFPGQKRDFFWELYGALGFGPFSAKLSHDFDNKDTYAEAALLFALGSGINLDLHAGYYFIKSDDLGDDYADFSAAISKMFGKLDAKLGVTDTTQDPSSKVNDTTVFVSLKYLF